MGKGIFLLLLIRSEEGIKQIELCIKKLAKSCKVSILEEKRKQKAEFYPLFCSDETTCKTLSRTH